jgi:hypothetical protein
VDNLDQEFFAVILKSWSRLLAVEMEGAGAAEAIELAKSNGYDVHFMMVRGISDMPQTGIETTVVSQTSERDEWKKYAAEVAAVFTISYIKNGLPKPPLSKLKNMNEVEKLQLPEIQEILYKDEVTEGMFFRIEPAWPDFEKKYVLERIEVDELINNLEQNKIQTLIGDAGSGKSIILKTVGFRMANYKTVYYLDFKKYDVTELKKYLREIAKSKERAIFILDDIHLYYEECEKLLNDYRKSGRGWIIAGSRDVFRFEGHPKYLSIFDNINKLKISAHDIADKLVELFLKRNYHLDKTRIDFISERLGAFKDDLWLLSWALLAYKPEYSNVNKNRYLQ